MVASGVLRWCLPCWRVKLEGQEGVGVRLEHWQVVGMARLAWGMVLILVALYLPQPMSLLVTVAGFSLVIFA